MNGRKLDENKCRICLNENVQQEWNDFLHGHDHLTYKDCYYKYTQLECFDGDNLYLSEKICCSCSKDLEYVNTFISKAIETHNLLVEKLSLHLITVDEDIIKQDETNFEIVLMDEMDIKPDIRNLPMLEDSVELFKGDKENENCSISGRFSSSVPQKRGQHKRKRTKRVKKVNGETLSSEVSLTKKKKSSKPWEVPTCCSICSKVLYSKYTAIQHEKIHLERRERKETCIECGLKFYDKVALKSHMLTHIENREKTRKCEFCDKAFYNTGSLNVHRRIHLGQMISCSLCRKEYYRQIDLDKHMVSHSATRINADIKLRKKIFVRCETCGENVRSTNYKSHSAKHTNAPIAKCAICDKEFFSRNSCVSHLKKFHKKGSGERSNFVITLETKRCTNLFLQQNTSKIFSEE